MSEKGGIEGPSPPHCTPLCASLSRAPEIYLGIFWLTVCVFWARIRLVQASVSLITPADNRATRDGILGK